VTGIDLGIDTEHVGDIGVFYEPSVEDLLSQVIELVGIDSSLDSDGVISLLADDPVEHLGEPPDTFVIEIQYHSCGRRSLPRI